MTDFALVRSYVDAALEQLRRQDLMRWPGRLPEAMVDSSIAASNDWAGWKAIPSTVTTEELNDLERETGLPFPPLYRELLTYKHFVELTERGISFERHLSHNWLDTLRRAYFASWPREKILDVGLLPFGNECLMDAGPVCFDTRRRLPDGDCPVVFWDHDREGTEEELRPLFSSCAKMFECLAAFATHDVNFMYHGDDDDLGLLPSKRALLAEFLAMDPDGAGGPGKTYWTGWGVDAG